MLYNSRIFRVTASCAQYSHHYFRLKHQTGSYAVIGKCGMGVVMAEVRKPPRINFFYIFLEK